MLTKVYRSGNVAAPATRGVEAHSYLAADTVKPAGRQGRTDAIFAAPNLDGVLRWVRSGAFMDYLDPFARELTVDPDTVHVYSFEAWEEASSWDSNYEKYWATGVTLTEWLANADSYDPREWELLLAATDIVSVKPVSDVRLVKASENFSLYSDLKKLLKDARRAVRFATV